MITPPACEAPPSARKEGQGGQTGERQQQLADVTTGVAPPPLVSRDPLVRQPGGACGDAAAEIRGHGSRERRWVGNEMKQAGVLEWTERKMGANG
ncbi:hypothetical protein AGIG_G14811 [Arapaima gigas]